MSDKLNVRPLRWPAVLALVVSLIACVSGGASPPASKLSVPPQVVYRIDDHRYFEITPDADGECLGKMLYFVDTAKSIHSQAVLWDNVMTRGKFVIDAANDQYLVAPVTRGNTDRSSGGGGGGDKMPYSTDGGRTWKRAWAPSPYYDLMISGSTAYQSHRNEDLITSGLDLTVLPGSSDTNWKFLRGFVFQPRIAPLDTKVRCSAKPKPPAK